MKDKPQLSAEMEKRFDEEFGKEAQSAGMLDLYDFYEGGIYQEIKHFLATALKDERQRVLGEILDWLDEKEIGKGKDEIFDDGAFDENRKIYIKIKRLKGE